jgi:hypothetical protein
LELLSQRQVGLPVASRLGPNRSSFLYQPLARHMHNARNPSHSPTVYVPTLDLAATHPHHSGSAFQPSPCHHERPQYAVAYLHLSTTHWDWRYNLVRAALDHGSCSSPISEVAFPRDCSWYLDLHRV